MTKNKKNKGCLLAERLAEILIRLQQGDVHRKQLAEELGVTERTIYRDLHDRLALMVEPVKSTTPSDESNDRYRLISEYRGKFNQKDLHSLARMLGADSLFPENSSRNFLLSLLDTLAQDAYLIRGHRHEKIAPQNQAFAGLEATIKNHHWVSFLYSGKPRRVAPYRLINQHGIWYLAAAEDNETLKAFSFSKISHLQKTEEAFISNPAIPKQISGDDDIWFTREKIEVLLNIAPEAAYYFNRRALLPQQEIVRELDNGGLIISSKVSHPNQLLPIVRYWIPKVRIIEPAELRETLVQELKQYLA